MFFSNAVPIWLEGKEKSLNSICAFFTSFDKMDDVSLHITGSNFYKVFLNGEMIAVGPARAAHGYFRVDEIKLNNLKESNSLFIEAAGYNTMNYWALNQPAFLQAEITSCGKPILWTGRHFTVREYRERLDKVCRFSYQRTFTECYNFAGNPQETYLSFSPDRDKPELGTMAAVVSGGNLIRRGTNYPTYKVLPSHKIETGVYYQTDAEPYKNVCFDVENLKIFPKTEWITAPSDFVCALEYEKKPLAGSIKKGEYAVFDFGYAETGFIKIEVKTSKPSVIQLIYDEINLNEDEELPISVLFSRNYCVNIIEYQLGAGEYIHSSFEPYTARYVKVIVKSGELESCDVSMIEYSNPDADKFTFSCEDSRLEEIVEAARRTFKHNAVDLLTDCPSRERAGWLCDSYFSAQVEKLFTGNNKVEQDFLENFALAPKINNIPELMLPMCYPADFETTKNAYIPNWSMWYIIELYDEYLRSANFQTAKMSEQKVRNLIKFFDKYTNSDGLLENLEGWVFVEWSMANDPEFICGVNYPSNMLYCLALECAGKLYNDSKLLERSNSMKSAIQRFSFNGTFFEDNSIRKNGQLLQVGHTTETCQYYAFFCGVATPQTYPQLFETMVNSFGATRDIEKVFSNVHKSNAFIGNYLRLIMLAKFGKKENISSECVEFFYKMAKTTGTLWENDNPCGSLDHGFASYAANLIVDYVSGFVGCNGKNVEFSDTPVKIDCEIHIPIMHQEIIFKRVNGVEQITIPNGFNLKRV